MQFVSIIVDSLRSTISQERSLFKISPFHRATSGTCRTIDFYRFGIYAEIVSSSINLFCHSFADDLTKGRGRFTSVIVLSTRYQIGNSCSWEKKNDSLSIPIASDVIFSAITSKSENLEITPKRKISPCSC